MRWKESSDYNFKEDELGLKAEENSKKYWDLPHFLVSINPGTIKQIYMNGKTISSSTITDYKFVEGDWC
jgi:hypothetical protein